MGDLSAERYSVDVNVERRHEDTDKHRGFAGSVFRVFLDKKNFAVGRCQNNSFFIGRLSFRVTKKIKRKQECRGRLSTASVFVPEEEKSLQQR